MAALIRALRALPPVLRILLAQTLGAALVFSGLTAIFPAAVNLMVMGVLAGVFGALLGLGRGWFPVQVALPFAIAAALWMAIPAWVYLVLFLGLVLVFWNSARGRVPLYLTNRKTRAALDRLIPPDAASVADLGCGLGGVVLGLGRLRPSVRFLGVESAPVPFAVSWLRLRFSGLDNAEILFGDFWKRDLRPFDVVYCFLSPVPMAELYRKVRGEMRPGTLLVSNSFLVPDVPPDRVVEVDDRRRTKLHVWTMG